MCPVHIFVCIFLWWGNATTLLLLSSCPTVVSLTVHKMHYGIARSRQEVSEQPSLCRAVEESAHRDSWMNYQVCHIADCFSHNLDNQKKHSPLQDGREKELARKSLLAFKTQPADSLASILLSARWIIDKSANTLRQRGGNTRCMSIMPLNRPSTRTNNSIYKTNTASDFAPFFFSWNRARLRFINILTFSPFCASNLSFISLSLSKDHRLNVYSCFCIFLSTHLSLIDICT